MKHRIMSRVLTAAAGVLLLAQQSAAESLRLRWSELRPVVDNRKIRAVLDGVRVEGKALQVEPDALRLKITRTGDRRAWPKGEARIPRGKLTAFAVTRHAIRWRPILTLGFPALIALAIWQATPKGLEGGAIEIAAGIGAGAALGSAIGGYYLGKRLDRRTVQVTVIPD